MGPRARPGIGDGARAQAGVRVCVWRGWGSVLRQLRGLCTWHFPEAGPPWDVGLWREKKAPREHRESCP